MDANGKQKPMSELLQTSYLGGANAPYLESLYELYLADPGSVSQGWQQYFDVLPPVNGEAVDSSHVAIRNQFRQLAHEQNLHRVTGDRKVSTASGVDFASNLQSHDSKQVRVLQLINAYRFRGHQLAHFNPLEPAEIPVLPELELGHHGLDAGDLETEFGTGSLAGPDRASLRDIISILKLTYGGPIGAEYMHITSTEEKRWLQQRLEGGIEKIEPDNEEKIRLLERVAAAEALELYLHRKYVGQKRFSLEGGESLIPLLDELIQRAGGHGLKELVIGMAHRGRLNVLVNIMGKKPADLFLEFENKRKRNGNGSGDVKYHMGFSSDIKTPGGPCHVVLAFNPSHLEIVNPVVEGSVRARQERSKDADGSMVMPVLIHGDAAFAGQGVVMETFSMSQSRGYSTKGTVHIVINNQIGFTSSNQEDSRSSLYCTDVAKMVSAPIFHVDGDDPEAVIFITRLALDYRTRFRKDVVIDMVCYRRHGHSEADEPMATQPMMYQKINKKLTVRELYANKLVKRGVINNGRVKTQMDNFYRLLDLGKVIAPKLVKDDSHYPNAADWSKYKGNDLSTKTDTTISLPLIRDLSAQLSSLPTGFELHHSVARILEKRNQMASGENPVDWGFAETLAYASLLAEGHDVRLSGQDSGRGTFFHRHAVVYNQVDGSAYVPLRNLNNESSFLVINSLLSEEAVLAFEYGYAVSDPETLTIWEAQFGDFANNAQVVIDQFISAGEQKWNRQCGLVMFLPHGYEGQGPEHSSARVERYLQLCAQQNMQICLPTNSAQIFHLLRRQIKQPFRKPLIVMTPKSLLRHKQAVSSLDELSNGHFQQLIGHVGRKNDAGIKRVLFCSGKVYYDLLNKCQQENRFDIAIVRIEQLYPFPADLLQQEIKRYANVEKFIWVQEEPKNQGAWYASQHHMRASIGDDFYLEYAGRPLSAAPAVGYNSLHKEQLADLLDKALGEPG